MPYENKEYAKIWLIEGISYSDIGLNEEALEAYERAIELDPDCAEAWCNKSSALAKLGRNEEALEAALRVLKPGGKMGVISFHSLEDRIVKRFFKKMSLKCICPPEAPICTCRAKSIVKILTKKPVAPEESEVKENQPSRSSKLRVVEKVNEL